MTALVPDTGTTGRTLMVFVFAPLPYDHTRSRKHAFAQAAHHAGMDAIYVEPPNSHSRYTSDSRPPTLARPGVPVASADGPRVLCVPKKWRIGPIRAGLSKQRMAPHYARWLANALAPITDGTRPTLAIVTTAIWEPLLRYVAFDAIVYDKTDEAQNLRGSMPEAQYRRQEEALLERSQLLIAPSTGLLDAGKRIAPDIRAVRVPNGVDIDAFLARRGEPVPEFEGVTAPLIGFLGTLGHYVDIDLIVRCAQTYPQYRFAVVGGAVRDEMRDALRAEPNIDVYGPVPYERVASIMDRFSVCVIPFRKGAVSDSANPVTFFEELSLGKPIVMTPMPELAEFTDLCYITRDGFVDAIAAAVNETDGGLAQRRREAVRNFTWTAQFNRILEALPEWPGAGERRTHPAVSAQEE